MPDSSPRLHLPTDLAGITSLTYESQRRDNNWMAALNPSCQQIKYRIAELKSFQDANTNINQIEPNHTPELSSKNTSTKKVDTKKNLQDITVEPYKQSYLIKGNTSPIKESLRGWARWNSSLKGWVLPKSKIEEFKESFPNFIYN